MRLYTICNMYLSSIQNGIQSAHVVHELFLKYDKWDSESTFCRIQLNDWATNHKTMIVTNGGMTEHMEPIIPIIEATGLPWATFYEPGIGNALTCIGVVVPERLYNAGSNDLTPNSWLNRLFGISTGNLTDEEIAFVRMLKSKPLAR